MKLRAKFVSIFEPTIPEIVDRYRRQYQLPDGSWNKIHNGDSKTVYETLCAAKSLEDIDAAIGNTSWTRHVCDGCYLSTRKIVFIGAEGDKGYCETCISEAAYLLSGIADGKR